MPGCSWKALRLWLLVFLYCLTALWGMRSALPTLAPRFDVLLSVVFPLALALLCIVDSRAVGRPMVWSFHWLLFLLWPVAVPAYALWSRGFGRGCLLTMLHAAGMFITLCAALVAASIALFVLYWIF
jgi:hypothetical protein